MKKLSFRALIVAFFALAMIAGMSYFGYKLYSDGGSWAAYQGNGNIYRSGKLKRGEIKDRDGETLATIIESGVKYSGDGLTRESTLHLIGDSAGNIAYGAVREFRKELAGWDYVNGVKNSGEVALSVSAKLQRAAYEALSNNSGAVAVINYRTGEIVCCATSPSYDPENMPAEMPEGAYLNRAISSAYTPGSVFKLVTFAAAIENIPDLYEREFHCEGSLSIGGGTVTCTRAHGDMKIEDALASSCNCVFAELAAELGGKIMAEYCEKLGITGGFEIEGAKATPGRYDGESLDAIALAWSGAGQSSDLVTPVSMARLCAAIANGGSVNRLSLLKDGGGEAERLMSADTADKLASAMAYNVAHSYGEENFEGLILRAKSGTAEVGAAGAHSWFVGYVENENAPYAFAVIVEHGGWGIGAAAQVAKTVLNCAVQ